MVLAVAALLFQFSPAGLPLPQFASAAEPSKTNPAPVLFATNLPDAPTAPATAISTASATPSRFGANRDELPSSPAPSSLQVSLQNSQMLSLIRIPDQKTRFVPLESLPSRKKWIALSIVQHAAATFDAYSTRDAISHGAVEQDPLMRPFANSSAMYAAIQVLPVGLDFAAHRMQRSQNSLARRTWWLPQSISTGMFLFSGVHNIRVANQR